MDMNILVEGIDNVGKSTLVKGLTKAFFYHSPIVMHSIGSPIGGEHGMEQSGKYYNRLFSLLATKGLFIVDRSHIGEVVYSPIYRGYNGHYVLEVEDIVDDKPTILFLLVASDVEAIAEHEDGESLSNGELGKMLTEQQSFVNAFSKSKLRKHIIRVTGKDQHEVLQEALECVDKFLEDSNDNI